MVRILAIGLWKLAAAGIFCFSRGQLLALTLSNDTSADEAAVRLAVCRAREFGQSFGSVVYSEDALNVGDIRWFRGSLSALFFPLPFWVSAFTPRPHWILRTARGFSESSARDAT